MYIKRYNTGSDNTVQGADVNPLAQSSPQDAAQGAPQATMPKNAASGNDSWYNIQDYLKGNQGATGNTKAVNKQAAGAMNQAGQQQNAYNQQVSTIADPTEYTSDTFNKALDTVNSSGGATNPLTGYTNQTFTTPDAAQKVENPFKNVNNYSDINSWFGSQPGGQYNQGQNNTDQLLMGNSNYLPQFKNDTTDAYKQQVENPYNQTEDKRQANVNDENTKYLGANTAWKGGLQNYLNGVNTNISNEQARETAAPAANAGKSIDDIINGMGGNANQQQALRKLLSPNSWGTPTENVGGLTVASDPNSAGSSNWVKSNYGDDAYNAIQSILSNPSQYFNNSGNKGGDAGTAMAQLGYTPGSTGVNDYNAVAAAIGNPTMIGSAGSSFNPSSSFNKAGFTSALQAALSTPAKFGALGGLGKYALGDDEYSQLQSLLG